MPWFPDFVSAVELVRRQTRAAGQADPVGQYFAALNQGDTHDLETAWLGEVVVYDPHAGEIRGHWQLRQFVRRSRLSMISGGSGRAWTGNGGTTPAMVGMYQRDVHRPQESR
jgi:hypothetical protein